MRSLPAVVAALVLGGLFGVSAAGADDPPPITKRQLITSSNNLKQIGIAHHAYFDANNAFPADSLDKDGKPLLSWRVAILPYLEETALYQQFKLDEPWDSKTNKALIEKMPKIYAPIRVKAKAGETFYQRFTGEGTLFVKHVPVYKLANIPDGTSNTGLVFEAGDPVTWTKPEDLTFDEKKAVPKLGGLFDGEFHVGMADGSVRLIKKKPDETELKKLIMPADGNVIDFGKLDK